MQHPVTDLGRAIPPSGVVPYQPSGMVGPTWPLAFATGVLGAFLLGSIYAFLAVFNPCISLVNIVFAFGAGWLAGKCVAFGIRVSKIRSPKLAIVLGVVSGLLLIAFAWLGFVAFLIARSQRAPALAGLAWIESIQNPAETISFIFGPLLETGWFDVRGYVPTGTVLAVGWLLEAGCLMFGCVGAALEASQRPFNERMGIWFKSMAHPGWFELSGRDAKDATPLHFADLERLTLGGTSAGRLEVNVHFIPGHREDMLLSVECVQEVPEDPKKAAKAAAGKGDPKKVKMKTTREDVLAPHFVPASWIDRLDTMFAQSRKPDSDGTPGSKGAEAFVPPWA